MVDTLTMTVETRPLLKRAADEGTLTVFLKAVREAGLQDLLEGNGPFTLFAPDDAAFRKLPTVTVRDLFGDKQQLAELVKYHILAGKKLTSADVLAMRSALTLRGKNVLFDTMHGILVNNIPVKRADIECRNGVIHIIDSVLIP
jgi:uncharacterized surface protein with fasciclin (FAS1) repeats